MFCTDSTGSVLSSSEPWKCSNYHSPYIVYAENEWNFYFLILDALFSCQLGDGRFTVSFLSLFVSRPVDTVVRHLRFDNVHVFLFIAWCLLPRGVMAFWCLKPMLRAADDLKCTTWSGLLLWKQNHLPLQKSFEAALLPSQTPPLRVNTASVCHPLSPGCSVLMFLSPCGPPSFLGGGL